MYHIVALEAVNNPPVAIIKVGFQLFRTEVGRDMGKLPLLLPYVISRIEKLTNHYLGISPEILMSLKTDVIEADVVRVAFKLVRALFVESVAVNVIVNFVVVYHLSDAQVLERSRVVGYLKILAEYLHNQRLARSHLSAEKQIVTALIALVGEYFLGFLTVVEVVEQEPQYVTIVVIDLERLELTFKSVIRTYSEKLPMLLENLFVRQVI